MDKIFLQRKNRKTYGNNAVDLAKIEDAEYGMMPTQLRASYATPEVTPITEPLVGDDGGREGTPMQPSGPVRGLLKNRRSRAGNHQPGRGW